MLLNGLTRGQKTVCNWPRPSLEVIQEVRTWGICLKLNSLMNFSFILYLSSFKQFVHCSLVSGCDRYLLKKIFQSLYGSLLNHLFHYTNKNISVKPLFNLHYLSLFQLPFYSFKNCSVHGGSCRNYSPKSLGFFWKIFRWVYKKKKLLFTSQGRDKLCTVFSAGTQDLGHTYFDV